MTFDEMKEKIESLTCRQVEIMQNAYGVYLATFVDFDLGDLGAWGHSKEEAMSDFYNKVVEEYDNV